MSSQVGVTAQESLQGASTASCSIHTIKELAWKRVGCSYRPHGTNKVVLQDAWGTALSGEVQALMGPSGAGKSTLMDILAMRKSTGQLTGSLLLDGQPASHAFIKQAAYVPQDDNFIPAMTTREVLHFYADITLPAPQRKARSMRVNEVLAAVGLETAAHTLVGGSLPGGLMLRGLSGGERRRLSIAAGILAAPAVLFLDEPTSGLDSFAALSVMSHLQGMARGSGCIVISTIHQPRDAIWEMFDKVTLLAGGRLMYHGPRTNISAWFASLGYPRLHGSESDWLLDLVATGFDKPQQLFGNALMAREDIPAAADAFLAHYLQTTNKKQQDTAGEAVSIHKPPKRSASASSLSALRSCVGGSGSLQAMQPARWEYPTSLGRQFCSLLWREVLAITRNPFDLAGRILTCTYLGLVFGLVFYNTPADTLPGVRTRMSICFVIPMVATLLPSVSISLYTNDKRIYLADSSAKLYRPWAYYSSKVLATSPFNVFGILCMAWVLYGMAGLRPGWQPVLKAGTVSGLLYLIAMQAMHLSLSLQAMHLCSVVAPNQDLTFCAFLIWLVINFAMSSFFVNFREVATNVWLTQLRYISALYYSLEALTVNEFHGSSMSCSGGLEPGLAGLAESALASITPGQHAMLQQLTQPQESCLIRNDALLEYMQYGRPFGVSVAILGGYLAVVHLLTYAALVLLARHEAR
ncbi:hypothetical protein OEZ85_006286 [Tetradesmus obliquus]|uniref:ABC transporter domain-containing protein n=1 Tax=Tetradesmus obliquus TaxID=3088 RepID=A0ABY8TY30_TETOB|nr:hypothetical protein OEZ85_006286 [Tetradesmus obliquus]